MDILLLENSDEIRQRFIDRFVYSWDEFQVEQKRFIDECAKNKCIIDINWYNQAYLWDRLNCTDSVASFDSALEALKSHSDRVLIMSEDETHRYPGVLFYQNAKIKNFVARVNAEQLAKLIEDEWYGVYRMAEQNMYNPNPILPEDLYIFDESMKWLIVFTHETMDWESEIDDPMKSAQSRYCIVYNIKE